MNSFNRNTFLLIHCFIFGQCVAQRAFYSESIIQYDISTHKTDKPIPFDRAFTLVVNKLSSKNVEAVQAYEAEFVDGNRILVSNVIYEHGLKKEIPVKDIELKINPYSDTLQIFFPPLKPEVEFDINIISKLSDVSREALLKVNYLIETGSSDAKTEFNKFKAQNVDKNVNRGYINMSFDEYHALYTSSLQTNFQYITDATSCTTSADFDMADLQAVDKESSKEFSKFKDAYYLVEVFERASINDLQTGALDIKKVFEPGSRADLWQCQKRIKNLESNLVFFDSLQKRIDMLISREITSTTINRSTIDFNTLNTEVNTIRNNIQNNHSALQERMNSINAVVDNTQKMYQGNYLVGNTVSSDLKTAGGNLLFIDAGLANIVVPDIKDNPVYLPKLYWGASIYFRPIDKNTRRNRFPKQFDPPKSNGANKDGTYGPDYGIVTRDNIWQNLCLNIGITLGSIGNKNFDNFYNNTSLLIGPAYRFKRAFKFSAGLALLKRTSKNPLISEMKPIAGAYASLSVDIDFIQSLKDITNILFK